MSLPKMHCTLLWQRAVNDHVSYFGAWAGSKAFQSPLKGCFQNIRIGSVGRDKREVPRRLCGEIIHTEKAGSSAKTCWQCHSTTVSKIQTLRSIGLLQSPAQSFAVEFYQMAPAEDVAAPFRIYFNLSYKVILHGW